MRGGAQIVIGKLSYIFLGLSWGINANAQIKNRKGAYVTPPRLEIRSPHVKREGDLHPFVSQAPLDQQPRCGLLYEVSTPIIR